MVLLKNATRLATVNVSLQKAHGTFTSLLYQGLDFPGGSGVVGLPGAARTQNVVLFKS